MEILVNWIVSKEDDALEFIDAIKYCVDTEEEQELNKFAMENGISIDKRMLEELLDAVDIKLGEIYSGDADMQEVASKAKIASIYRDFDDDIKGVVEYCRVEGLPTNGSTFECMLDSLRNDYTNWYGHMGLEF